MISMPSKPHSGGVPSSEAAPAHGANQATTQCARCGEANDGSCRRNRIGCGATQRTDPGVGAPGIRARGPRRSTKPSTARPDSYGVRKPAAIRPGARISSGGEIGRGSADTRQGGPRYRRSLLAACDRGIGRRPEIAGADRCHRVRGLVDGLGGSNSRCQPLRRGHLRGHLCADPFASAVGVHGSLPGSVARLRRQSCWSRSLYWLWRWHGGTTCR